jgi:polar amino acid transport system substrate-binding protein
MPRLILFVFLTAFIASPCLGQKIFHINSSYSSPLSTKAGDGFLNLVIKEAFSRIGHRAMVHMLPAERCLQDANTGLSDGDVGRVKGINEWYPNLRIVPEPVLEKRRFVAFTIGQTFSTDHWESLAPYHVGHVRGWKIFGTNSVHAKSVVSVRTTRQLFVMLAKDRIDVALNARLDGLAMAKQLGIRGVRVMEPPLASKKMYLYLHKSHDQLIPDLAQALQDLKQDGMFDWIKQDVIHRYIQF